MKLGLDLVTPRADPMYVDFGVDRATFDGLVREHAERVHDDSSLQPTRLALLYAQYRAAEARTRDAEVAHVVFWCAGLIIPPLVLLGIGRALRAGRRPSWDAMVSREPLSRPVRNIGVLIAAIALHFHIRLSMLFYALQQPPLEYRLIHEFF